MKAKEYLLQAKKLDCLIKNKMIEKEQYYQMALSTGSLLSGDRVQSSGSKEKMSDTVIKYVDIENEIDSCIQKAIDARREIIYTIEQLDQFEYELLHLVYIQYKSLLEASEILDRTYSCVTTIHGRALKNVQEILDERKFGK